MIQAAIMSGQGILNPSAAMGVLAFVLFLFVFGLGIVWALRQIDPRLSAEIEANLKRCGASLAVSGRGLVGTYLAIMIALFLGIYLILRWFIR